SGAGRCGFSPQPARASASAIASTAVIGFMVPSGCAPEDRSVCAVRDIRSADVLASAHTPGGWRRMLGRMKTRTMLQLPGARCDEGGPNDLSAEAVLHRELAKLG